MEWTTTRTARWRLILSGLVVGPALLVASNAFIVGDAPGGMRATFDAMTAHTAMLVAESILEALGFVIALAAFAVVTGVVNRRGASLSTTGAALCVIGTVGFTWSAAGGVFLSILAGMPDHDAGFAAAMAFTADPVSATVISLLMYAGEAGIVLVLIGMLRAGLIRVWPLVIVVAGVVADLMLPGVWSGLVADVLLLVAGLWTALSLRAVAHGAVTAGVASAVRKGAA